MDPVDYTKLIVIYERSCPAGTQQAADWLASLAPDTPVEYKGDRFAHLGYARGQQPLPEGAAPLALPPTVIDGVYFTNQDVRIYHETILEQLGIADD
jgi:hypothetical protein